MKNRIILFILAFVAIGLFSIEKIVAQTIGSDGTYIHVYNYSGAVQERAFRLQLGFQNEDYLNSELLELSVAVKVNSPIANSEAVFNAEKLKIRLNGITQGLILPNASNKTEYQLNDGADPIEIIKSSADLRKYGTYRFSFDIIVEVGAYLEDLVRDIAYNVGLTFYVTILKKEGSEFKEVYSNNTYYNVGMQIHKPLGGTPPKPTFSFEVHADASLNFNVPEDYTRKVESSEESWLKVTSKDKGYTVNVHTSDSYFEGESDIPVGVVSMQVEDKIGSRTGLRLL